MLQGSALPQERPQETGDIGWEESVARLPGERWQLQLIETLGYFHIAYAQRGTNAGPAEVPREGDQGRWGQGVALPRGSSIRPRTTPFNGDLMMMSSRPLPAFTSPLGGCGETGFHGRLALSLTLEPRGQHFYGDEATQFL